jgi:hypothetical protein
MSQCVDYFAQNRLLDLQIKEEEEEDTVYQMSW